VAVDPGVITVAPRRRLDRGERLAGSRHVERALREVL
jgi:hypothetical protein